MAKLLCIEDSQEFFLYLKTVLKEHDLTHVTNLNDAFKIIQNGRNSFDLILLDVSLPDGNGIKSIGALKDSFSTKLIPIIVISSDGDVISKVAAFGIGADDYILKPPNTDELKARIAARLRSHQTEQKISDQIEIGNLSINSDRMMVQIHLLNGKSLSVDLTPSEFKLLKKLSLRPGQVFSRDQLIDEVWGISKYITQRTVDAHMSHLRKKIIKSNVKIETVLSIGYKISVINSM
ncbi:MAG: response regulator transcription factor [Bdellovibrionales bacterium]|nr:response regulator transcription factor [Bdellovibrionales bacterium]